MSYESTLLKLARQDERVVVLTAENRAPIRNLPPTLGTRFIDVGIAEQTLVGAAAGLALRGRIPVVHALATFLTMRAFEFIRTDVGIANLPVKLVGTVPGFLSEANGPTHQALEDVSLMRGIPGMSVVCPADDDDLRLCLPAVLAEPGPVYLRFCSVKPFMEHLSPFSFGKAEILSEGSDVGLLTYGFMTGPCTEAARVLTGDRLTVQLVSMRTLKPIDEKAIVETAERTRILVVVEDHFATGGLGSIVAEVLLRRRICVRFVHLALRERWFRPGLLGDVLLAEGFGGEQIAQSIRRALEGEDQKEQT
jgi:transketolase